MQTECAINIGPRETRKRKLIGQIALGVGLVAFVGLILSGLDPLWRLTLFVPWFVGVLAWLEAAEKT